MGPEASSQLVSQPTQSLPVILDLVSQGGDVVQDCTGSGDVTGPVRRNPQAEVLLCSVPGLRGHG